MILYLDTSSLVKLYVEEMGSDQIREMNRQAAVVSTSKIAYAEARSAFSREQREGGFSLNILRKLVEEFDGDWENYFLIEVTDGLIRSAGDLAEKHFLRGFDSLHLASAIQLKNKTRSEIYFSSTEVRLNRSAEKEGMKVVK